MKICVKCYHVFDGDIDDDIREFMVCNKCLSRTPKWLYGKLRRMIKRHKRAVRRG